MNKQSLYLIGGALLATVALSSTASARVASHGDLSVVAQALDHLTVATIDAAPAPLVDEPAFFEIRAYEDLPTITVEKTAERDRPAVAVTTAKAVYTAPRGGAAVSPVKAFGPRT